MARLGNIVQKKKLFKAQHMDPGEMFMDFILLPVGYGYNTAWANAKKGDKIRFHDGIEYTIYCVRLVKMKGGLADILSRMRYGISIAGCIQRWRSNARLEGHGPDSVSDKECLWVIYEKEPV